MDWVYIVLLAYLLQAVVFIFDSLLVNKKLGNATSYAFFISILGLAAFLLAPFGFSLVSPTTLVTATLAGASFTYGTLFLYRALKKHETSRVIPIVGGTVPIFSFFLSFLFLAERLKTTQLIAFIILVAGTVLITYPFHPGHATHHIKPRMIGEMLLSALLFACWGMFSKRVFMETDFINGVIWVRVGAAAAGLLLLLGSTLRKEISHGSKKLNVRMGGAIIGNKAVGAVAGLLLLYAIANGDPTLVHALQGVQFVFLLGLVVAFSHWLPRIFKEDLRPKLIAQKLISSIVIGFGVALLLV
ncbi:MAG: EamA family transporter [Candidatus Magasanikbacteria bacterium]|nr:EamA family transporter [Candidatus Magasanikbacteria bacterium]